VSYLLSICAIYIERCKISNEIIRWTAGTDYKFFHNKCYWSAVPFDIYVYNSSQP